jgi:hypothetical protein
VTPIKAVFVEHGVPADFDETMSNLIAALDEATQRKSSGRRSNPAVPPVSKALPAAEHAKPHRNNTSAQAAPGTRLPRQQ